MTLVGLDRYFSFAEMIEIPALWQKLVPHLGTTPSRVEPVDYGVCHDMGSEGFRYLAGFEVSEVPSLPADFSTFNLPAQRYAVFEHEGDLSVLCDTIDSIWKAWLPASGEQAAEPPLMFERYGPAFDPQARKGDIQVWLALK